MSRKSYLYALLLLVVTGFTGAAAWAQPAADTSSPARRKLEIPRPTPLVREADVASGANLTLEVNVGEVHILPTDKDGKLRLVLNPGRVEDEADAAQWVREFSVTGTQGKIVLKMPKHGDHTGDIDLYVPRTTHLKANLDVGELHVDGIAGDKDLTVGIGELDVTGIEPAAYHSVDATVHIGDVNDSAFELVPSGFLGKSARRETGTGPYRLRLHVTIGDITVQPEADRQTAQR